MSTPPDASIDYEKWVDLAEKIRDRPLSRPLSFKEVPLGDLPQPHGLPAPVADERRFLIETLFGLSEAPPAGVHPDADRAVYVESTDTVFYHRGADLLAAKRAIFSAIVSAIDQQQSPTRPASNSWDGYLAQKTADHATRRFALAGLLLAENPDADLHTLAKRPAILARLLTHNERSDTAPTPTLTTLEERFIHLESATLAAALFRSNGWSGVELAYLTPPPRTSDLVQPGDWLQGSPRPFWIWPEPGMTMGHRRGRVGAAFTSFWLSSLVEPASLRSLFAGWRGDSYRFWPQNGDQPSRFEWLTLWDTPFSAQQIAQAFDRRLSSRALNADFTVIHQGLRVGVVISDTSQKARQRRAHDLLEHRLQLMERPPLPLNFTPSRADEVAQERPLATYDQAQWSDPLSSLQLDLSSLSDWTIDRPEQGAVRWFARHPDGALIQLTMQLSDPLGPPFGSQAYREGLRRAFSRTVEQAKLSGWANVELSSLRALHTSIDGVIDQRPTRLKIWHFPVEDLLFTFSYQAPKQSFAKHLDSATRVISSVLRPPQNPKPNPDAPPSGVIDFKIED